MEELKWIEDVSKQIKDKMRIVAERSKNKIPYKTVNGIFDDLSEDRIGWWTNGFWGGMMWQLYHTTKDDLYREIAQRTEEKMECVLMDRMHMSHDSGFRFLPTAVANYKITGNQKSFNRAILAADNLAGRFNPTGRFIRAWNEWPGEKLGSKAGVAIIDCMMNLPLLYWAYEELKDPRYLQIATMHADTVQQNFIREDGSVKHIVDFDPQSGAYIGCRRGQGYAEDSSWTRGQGWAIYGFTLSYMHSGKEAYLDTARKVADYFISCIPESGLVPVDFRQPAECTSEDSTAAAVAACGMIEIARALEKSSRQEEASFYMEHALSLLKALYDKRCNWSTECDNILEKCSVAYHTDTDRDITLTYADYYFVEAIWKLTGQEIFIW